MNSLLHWLVVRTHPQKEFDAERQIKDRGYDALCPYEEKWRRRHSRTNHKRPWKYPLFTRYVFAGVNHPWDWHDIRQNVDVVQYTIGSLTPVDVDYLQRLSHEGYNVRTDPHRAIKVGGEAKISDGSFQGHTVTIHTIVGKQAHVVVQMFNSYMPVQIPLAKLDPV